MSEILNDKQIHIALKENGLHSLWKGIEAYENAKDGDRWSLKDAIMYVHHGVELLMKQILVQQSEYLLFEDLGDATLKKQKQANEKQTGVFFLEKPPRTVTFMDAIRRVEVFVKPPELDDKLIDQLQELNGLRNQVEHYAINIDKDDVVKLLGGLHRPLLALFEARIGGTQKTEPVPLARSWKGIELVLQKATAAEEQVAKLMARFHGQSVPGALFGMQGTMRLPDFERVASGYRWSIDGMTHEVDVLGTGKGVKWAVEIKVTRVLEVGALHKIAHLAQKLNATPWVAFTGTANVSIRKMARGLKILLSDKNQIEELKRLVR